MRRLCLAGLAASFTVITMAAPAFADPPGIELRPGNGGTHGVVVGGPRGVDPRSGGIAAPPRGGFGGPGGGQRFSGPAGNGERGVERRHRGFGGAAVGAGLAGLAAGALIGGAFANQQPGYGYGNSYGYGDNGYYAPAPAYVAPAPAYAEEEPVDDEGPDGAAYCQRRYRSYDPRSGTFIGFDGQRHPCP